MRSVTVRKSACFPTYLLRQHVPLELGKILHRPYIVSPSCSFLSPDWLSVEHPRNGSGDSLILEFHPAFDKVGLLCGGVFPP